VEVLSEEIIENPAKNEYLFSFGGGIFGDYAPEQKVHSYLLLGATATPEEVLKNLEMSKNYLSGITFKVKIGETLEEAVKMVLKDSFGLNELYRLEFKISGSEDNLVYVRAICRNTPLEGKKFGDLNLYWYQWPQELAKGSELTPEIFEQPATKEYFVRFVEINGAGENGEKTVLKFRKKGYGEGEIFLYCDKVRVGETLRGALTRSLRDEFGLELISFDYFIFPKDGAKNKYGEYLPRVSVKVLVKFGGLKQKTVAGMEVEWIGVPKAAESKEAEALEWINKETTFNLAANRFGSKKEAGEFIEKLYAIGAVKVVARDIEKSGEGEWSDGLAVSLPKDRGLREKILKIYNEELQREFPGEKEEKDTGQLELFFWWD